MRQVPSSAARCSKGQYSRDKGWWKWKSCFIQEASNLGRWWTNVLRPSPSCQLGDRGLKDSVSEGAAGCMTSSCTILGLVGIKVKFWAPSIFQFQQAWGLCAWGQQFSSGEGLLPVEATQDCVSGLCIFQGTGSSGTADLWSKLLPVSWHSSYSLFLHLHIS